MVRAFFLMILLAGVSQMSLAQQARPADPYLSLGKILPAHGKLINVSKKDLLANTKLTMNNCVGCKVTEFTLSVIQKGHDFMGPYTVKGDEFTPEIKHVLQDINAPDTRVLIEGIRVMTQDKTIRSLSSISLNIIQ